MRRASVLRRSVTSGTSEKQLCAPPVMRARTRGAGSAPRSQCKALFVPILVAGWPRTFGCWRLPSTSSVYAGSCGTSGCARTQRARTSVSKAWSGIMPHNGTPPSADREHRLRRQRGTLRCAPQRPFEMPPQDTPLRSSASLAVALCVRTTTGCVQLWCSCSAVPVSGLPGWNSLGVRPDGHTVLHYYNALSVAALGAPPLPNLDSQ